MFVSSLFFIAPVFASAVDSPALIKLTQEQLAEINNMPSVEINNIYLPKSVYSSGEEISGTFILKNDRDYNLPDLKYKISLTGNYKNGLAGIIYDSKFYGPVFLKATESKEVKFSYLLPSNVAGKDLAIQIQFYTVSGLPLAWSDKFLEVTGETSMLSVLNSYIGIGEKKYTLQAGPTLSSDKKGILYIEINNPFDKVQTLFPEVKIYDRAVSGKNLENLKLDEITIAPKTTKVFEWEISYLPKPGVYEASVDFFNDSGSKIVPTTLARYIVGGQIATIQYVYFDKNSLTKGENYNLKVAYSGTPVNIDLASSENENLLNLSVIVSNENNKKVSEYANKIDFNKGSSITIPLVASVSAQKLLLNIKVTDDNGNIITSYSNEINDNSVLENNNKIILYVVIILLAIILITIIVLYSKKNKAMKITMIFMALFLSFSLLAPGSASANSVNWVNIDVKPTPPSDIQFSENLPSIILSVPESDLDQGYQFKIQGQLTTIACNNALQRWEIKRTDIKDDALEEEYLSYKYKQTYSKETPAVPDSHDVFLLSDQFSLDNDNGNFIASTPGDYYIGLQLKVFWGEEGNTTWGNVQTMTGYIKFTVSGTEADGGWTSWTPGDCSEKCGDGVQVDTRYCTNPAPSSGGLECRKVDGSRGLVETRQISCNLGACGEKPNITFTANPTRIFKGKSSTLKWTSDADSCTAVSGSGFNTNGRPNGDTVVSPTTTTKYKISCTNNDNKTETAEATVKVSTFVEIEI